MGNLCSTPSAYSPRGNVYAYPQPGAAGYPPATPYGQQHAPFHAARPAILQVPPAELHHRGTLPAGAGPSGSGALPVSGSGNSSATPTTTTSTSKGDPADAISTAAPGPAPAAAAQQASPAAQQPPAQVHEEEADPLDSGAGEDGEFYQMEGPVNWSKGKLIGAGAFGRVFQGLNNDTGQILAVKQVNLTKDEALKGRVAEHIKALEAEVAVLRTLRHRNIVRYLGTERTEDAFNIFLEYVPGGSIASLIDKFGPLQESVIRKYTQQILRGLEYLHQKKIMHRDIKGANILVDGQGTVKLADFGASKKIEDLATVGSGSKSIRGTPYWMAPEVIKQTGHGRPADIWSLGCVVIEMATGKPPWSNCNTQVAAMFHIASTKEPPTLPDVLSPEARDFLLLCFNRVPKERPNATRLLRHPWMASIPPNPGAGTAPNSARGTQQQRHPLVPMLPLQAVLSPPSPIKPIKEEGPDTARSAITGGTAASGTTARSSAVSSAAPGHMAAQGGPSTSMSVASGSNTGRAHAGPPPPTPSAAAAPAPANGTPSARGAGGFQMPLGMGPLEQARRQSLMPQTAASMAMSIGLPPLPPSSQPNVRASMAPPAGLPAVPPTPSAAPAQASSNSPPPPPTAAAPAPGPVPAASTPAAAPAPAQPAAPTAAGTSNVPPRVMTPIGETPEEQFDSIISPSSIPAALLAAAAAAKAAAAGAATGTTPALVPSTTAAATSQPASTAAVQAPAAPTQQAQPSASSSSQQSQRASVQMHAVRASMLTLDYNPMEEPSWMPPGGILAAVQEGSGQGEDDGEEGSGREPSTTHDSSDGQSSDGPDIQPDKQPASGSSMAASPRMPGVAKAAGVSSSKEGKLGVKQHRDQDVSYSINLQGFESGSMPDTSEVADQPVDSSIDETGAGGTFSDLGSLIPGITLLPSGAAAAVPAASHRYGGDAVTVVTLGPTAAGQSNSTPSASPALQSRPARTARGGGAGEEKGGASPLLLQTLAGVKDEDPVRQSKIQKWQDELSEELERQRKEARQAQQASRVVLS